MTVFKCCEVEESAIKPQKKTAIPRSVVAAVCRVGKAEDFRRGTSF